MNNGKAIRIIHILREVQDAVGDASVTVTPTGGNLSTYAGDAAFNLAQGNVETAREALLATATEAILLLEQLDASDEATEPHEPENVVTFEP